CKALEPLLAITRGSTVFHYIYSGSIQLWYCQALTVVTSHYYGLFNCDHDLP
ncbi:unnamed protein product, partial [Mycena citricolor]